MDDDLLTNFVATEPAPLSRSAERIKLKRLQRHKGLVSMLAKAHEAVAPPPIQPAGTMLVRMPTHENKAVCGAEERRCSEAW